MTTTASGNTLTTSEAAILRDQISGMLTRIWALEARVDGMRTPTMSQPGGKPEPLVPANMAPRDDQLLRMAAERDAALKERDEARARAETEIKCGIAMMKERDEARARKLVVRLPEMRYKSEKLPPEQACSSHSEGYDTGVEDCADAIRSAGGEVAT